MARLTQHGKTRGKERLGLSAPGMTHLATRAFERGQPPSAFAGRLRRYLDALALKGDAAIRIYGEQVYVFGGDDGESLVTVVTLPASFRRVLRRLRATKES